MKIQAPALSASSTARARCLGFTLPEMLIACTIFSMAVLGITVAHLFGLRMFQITQTKLNATSGARLAIGKMTDEIRQSKSVFVGNVGSGSFVGLLDGEKQQGGGLLILPTTNAANFILYFVNPSDQTFRRTSGGATLILARSVTNSVVFQCQDLQGNVLTNNSNNRVIYFGLRFYQPQSFARAADYYQLETAVARRASN